MTRIRTKFKNCFVHLFQILNKLDVMNWYNRTLSDWHQIIINGLSKNYNDLLCAPEAIYLILFDWCAYILGCLKDGKYNLYDLKTHKEPVQIMAAADVNNNNIYKMQYLRNINYVLSSKY